MTRESSPIVEFITARLDEREAAAKAVDSENWTVDDEGGDYCFIVIGDDRRTADSCGCCSVGTLTKAEAEHVALHDPASVLREVAGLRKLLNAHLGYYGADDDEHLPVPTLSILAAIWDDHEDYPAPVGTVTS